jgi:multidrug efflux pump subunit AcrA (membrane-fusion protein)
MIRCARAQRTSNSAAAVMEGAPPRTVSAPFQGVLAELAVRRGDTVKRGQLLARMDDRELQLERLRLGAARDLGVDWVVNYFNSGITRTMALVGATDLSSLRGKVSARR